MEHEIAEECVRIMKEIVKKPIALMFLNSVNESEDGMEDYYSIIRKPITLGEIQNKLQSNEYSSIQELKSDFQLIQANADKFFGKRSYYSIAAKELRACFLKMLERIEERNPKVWIKNVDTIDHNIQWLLNNMPENIKSKNQRTITLEPLPKMKNKTMRMLIDATAELNDKKVAQRFMDIILKFHPDMNIYSKDVEVDMDILSNETLWAIYWFTKKRFEEENKKFPEMI